MQTYSSLARIAACALCGAASAGAAPAAAQEIRVGPSSCSAGTTLLARQAKASDVLKQMSEALGFTIKIEEPVDSIVNIQSTRPAGELIALLLASRNVIVAQAVDPKCPGKHRVTAVWVLPAGNGKPVGARSPLPWVASPEAREQDETYLRAHGMLPEKPASEPAN